jgi:hypothetical protein
MQIKTVVMQWRQQGSQQQQHIAKRPLAGDAYGMSV